MTLLEDAIETLNARKRASNSDCEDALVYASEMPGVFSGTDVTVEEAAEYGTYVASVMIGNAVNAGIPVANAICSIWADGLLTGIVLADIRAKRDRIGASEPDEPFQSTDETRAKVRKALDALAIPRRRRWGRSQ